MLNSADQAQLSWAWKQFLIFFVFLFLWPSEISCSVELSMLFYNLVARIPRTSSINGQMSRKYKLHNDIVKRFKQISDRIIFYITASYINAGGLSVREAPVRFLLRP